MPPPSSPGTGQLTYPSLRRFTPVLTRGPRSVQVGFDQEPALVLDGVAPGLVQVLSLLDGCHHRREITAFAVSTGIAPNQLDWVLRTLGQAGLLDESGSWPGPPLAGHRIRLLGAGQLGKAVAEQLVVSGVAVLHLVDNEPPDSTLYPGALGSQAQALRSHLGASSVTQVRVSNHWTKPEERAPDLTILAGDLLECDRVVTEGLTRADQPHLILRPRAGGVVVGPLVLPGRTACVGCTDLARRDADPAWPLLLAQLCRTRSPITAPLAAWAAGVTAAQALALLSGSEPESCGATLEIAPTDYVTRRRAWPMHARCGCGWNSPAE